MSAPINWSGTAALVRHASSRFTVDGPVQAACTDAAKLCEREALLEQRRSSAVRASTDTVDAALSYTVDVDDYEGFMGPAQAAMSVLRDEVLWCRRRETLVQALMGRVESVLIEDDNDDLGGDTIEDMRVAFNALRKAQEL